MAACSAPACSGAKPNSTKDLAGIAWSRSRNTKLSPCTVGRLLRRRWIFLVPSVSRARPSCGSRFFRDIHAAEDFHAREQRFALRQRERGVVVHLPVETEAHEEAVLLWLEMHVARVVGNRRTQDAIERPGGIGGRRLCDHGALQCAPAAAVGRFENLAKKRVASEQVWREKDHEFAALS